MKNNNEDDWSCKLDYENKCDCSDDDNCGCTYPNNLGMDFDCECSCTPANHCGCLEGQECDCQEEDVVECDTISCRALHCDNIDCNTITTFDEENNANFADDCEYSSILVRDMAPNFIAPAVMPDNTINPDFNLYEYLGDDYGLVFFYPNDFTFVCPTEIIASNNRFEEFAKRNVKVVGISVDSVYSHLAWKKMSPTEGGIGDLKFPLVSDITKEISLDYGILSEDGVSLRATFIIDKDGIVRHQLVNDINIGRDFDESLRIIDALQFSEKNGNVCPAGWQAGDNGVVAEFDAVKDFLNKNAKKL